MQMTSLETSTAWGFVAPISGTNEAFPLKQMKLHLQTGAEGFSGISSFFGVSLLQEEGKNMQTVLCTDRPVSPSQTDTSCFPSRPWKQRRPNSPQIWSRGCISDRLINMQNIRAELCHKNIPSSAHSANIIAFYFRRLRSAAKRLGNHLLMKSAGNSKHQTAPCDFNTLQAISKPKSPNQCTTFLFESKLPTPDYISKLRALSRPAGKPAECGSEA